MHPRFALLVAGFLGSASIAAAGGMDEPIAPSAPVSPAPVAAPADWTGFYVGGDIGTGRSETDFFGSFDLDHSMYRVRAGYRHDFGTVVVGGELTYGVFNVDTIDDDYTRLGLDLKLGYDAGDLLPYVSLGLARLDNPLTNDTEQGYAYGVGLAYRINDRFSVNVDYQKSVYHDT